MTLRQAAHVLNGELHGSDLLFNKVIIDTKKVVGPCLFVALKGERFDAHNFVEQAKVAGACALLVSYKLEIALPQIVVKDTRLAFGILASWVRQHVPARIVALTGSTGKTTVKEMTASILNQIGNTLYTEGNLNNDIGVPLTLLELTPAHKFAVIELGANRQGEISWTANLSRPEVALVNNLSASHLEGFGSLKGIAKAKGEIYTVLPKNGIAIMHADNNDWQNWRFIIGNRKTWSFSLNSSSNSDFTATNIHIASHGTKFMLKTPFGSIDLFVPLPGYHNIINSLAASALSMSVGATLKDVQLGLQSMKAIQGRLFPIKLSKNKLLLDDSYNANIASMVAGIQVLSKMPGYRVLVVGDMNELGDQSEYYHTQVGITAKILGINHVLSTGYFSRNISLASMAGEHFSNKAQLVTKLKILIATKQTITVLVKGSRNTTMEEVVQAIL